jgi:hypothetical protein
LDDVFGVPVLAVSRDLPFDGSWARRGSHMANINVSAAMRFIIVLREFNFSNGRGEGELYQG